MTTYTKARNSMKTGDILLFSGKGPISWLIKKFTKSNYSHVAIVYRSTDDLILTFESTSLVALGQKGCQLNLLSNRLATYKGKIYWRSINKPIDSNQRKLFHKSRKSLLGLPYERSKLDLLLAGLGASREDGTKLTSVFCSELVAVILQRINILGGKKPPDAYSPDDFAKDDLKTHNGYAWLDPEQLTYE